MTRDWRKLAIAALSAAALALSYALPSHAQAKKQSPAAAKAQGGKPAAGKQSGDADADPDAQAKAASRKQRQDPIEAQKAVDSANKLIQSGKAEQAAQSLTATLAKGSLPPAIMAKALYLRGVAYRQTGKPAQAISDLTSALWLKGGLPDDERAEATKQRIAAYADAGVTEAGEPVAATPAATERQASTKSWSAQTAPEETSNSAPLGGNWFKDWFSGLQPSSAQSAPAPSVTGSVQKTEAPTPAAAAAPSTRVSTAWSSNADVQPEKAASPAGRGPVPAGKFEGRFRVQLATVRTQQEAQALALKAKRELADKIAGREPEIDQAVFGNMGAFYRVRVGPFATIQETQAICAQAKGPAFDCLPITQ